MKKSLFLNFILLTVLAHDFMGQTSLHYGLSFKAGRIIRNYPDFPDRGVSLAGVFEVFTFADGSKDWHKWYGYPEQGVMFAFSSFGNRRILGHALGVMPFLSVPIKHYRKGSILVFKLALGFAWFSNPFDKIYNPENLLAGSHLSNITQLALIYQGHLLPFIDYSLGIGFIHYSNGHTSLPNVGTNIPYIEVGIRSVASQEKKYERQEPVNNYSFSSLKFNIEFGVGMHELGETTEPVDGRKYPVYSGSLFLTRRNHPIHLWSGGITLNYYTSFYDYIKAEELFHSSLFWKSSTLIAWVGHEFLLGHWGIETRLGMYLTNTFRKKYDLEILHRGYNFKQWNTNRLSVNYYFLNTHGSVMKCWIGIYIKSNVGQADFAGLSTGYRF